ncbi:MAG: DUF3703 domain-containing protein [Pseudobdellovibrionaceae bacterium]
MRTLLTAKFNEQICIAKNFEKEGKLCEAWNFLERAHILGQFHTVPHLSVHWKMLVLAAKTRDRSELVGQVTRLLLAAPGSILKKAPRGNTGRSNVGIFEPMKIPKDLEEILSSSE